MKRYGKAIAMVVVTVAAAIVAALSDEAIVNTEWFTVVLAGVGAVNVAIVPNLDATVGKYAKLVIAASTAVLTLGATLIDGGITGSEWLQLLIVGAGAVGVYGLPGPQHPTTPLTAERVRPL